MTYDILTVAYRMPQPQKDDSEEITVLYVARPTYCTVPPHVWLQKGLCSRLALDTRKAAGFSSMHIMIYCMITPT